MDEIIVKLIGGESVGVVGPSDSGKTYWVMNSLIPELEARGKKVFYAPDGDTEVSDCDIVIFDEVETLFDKDRLEEQSGTSEPYYSEKYLEKVKRWQENYASRKEPALYVISRPAKDVDYLVKNLSQPEWSSRPISMYPFPF